MSHAVWRKATYGNSVAPTASSCLSSLPRPPGRSRVRLCIQATPAGNDDSMWAKGFPSYMQRNPMEPAKFPCGEPKVPQEDGTTALKWSSEIVIWKTIR